MTDKADNTVQANYRHDPVLIEEVLQIFHNETNTTYVDCTLGFGGHAKRILSTLPQIHTFVGIDMDATHLAKAKKYIGDQADKTLHFIHAPFGELRTILEERNLFGAITSIFLDLGVCSHHLDNPERGFAFGQEGPLDMRMDQSKGQTAADILATYTEEELASILFTYGEIKSSRKLAKALCEQRKKTPILTTRELSSIVEETLHSKDPRRKAQVFQALRIEVNNELEQVRQALVDGISALAPGGRMVVLSYHSLEDRITKQVFKDESTPYKYLSDAPDALPVATQRIRLLTKKPILASKEEILYNIRSRSVKLRACEKLLT